MHGITQSSENKRLVKNLLLLLSYSDIRAQNIEVINITLYPDMDLSQRNKEEVSVILLSRSFYAIFFSDFIQLTFFYISISKVMYELTSPTARCFC